MDAREWLGLQPTDDPTRWVLPVTLAVSTGLGFLFGGCALGAAIAAMEATTERPVVWAAAQYLSYAYAPATVDIDVSVAAAGRSISQAQAVGKAGDDVIFTVNAALGERKLDVEGTWVEAPDLPGPEDLPSLPLRTAGVETVMSRLDVRMANAVPWTQLDGHPAPGGRSALWARVPDLLEQPSGPALAILGDYVPLGIGQAIGRVGMSSSLDNTLRVHRLTSTEWVLLDIRIHAVANGFGHGDIHLWSRDGTLLATASQTAAVRLTDT